MKFLKMQGMMLIGGNDNEDNSWKMDIGDGTHGNLKECVNF